MSGVIMRPTPPTSSLPPVARLSRYSTDDVDQALQNLRAIYGPRKLPRLPSPAKALPRHLIHDTSVPDSGYASAEEDECTNTGEDDDEESDLGVLREDPFEKEFTIRWLTGFAARSETWVYDIPEEEDARTALVDAAASLLASFSGDEEIDDTPEDGLTRTFTFCGATGDKIEVVLNDAPLSNTDHTSVGLQSWGSAIVFAERMCASPQSFGLNLPAGSLRILELGAGTGLLSLAAAKLFPSMNPPLIVATDYHPSVLVNLQANVSTNFPCASPPPVSVLPLDWQHPRYDAPLDAPFDVVLAADVIYHTEHARWIKNCVEHLLSRDGGVFWLIIPVRSTGRHEGMGSTVDAVFPQAATAEKGSLAILDMERLEKHSGIGRADESGYTLYKIGWV